MDNFITPHRSPAAPLLTGLLVLAAALSASPLSAEPAPLEALREAQETGNALTVDAETRWRLSLWQLRELGREPPTSTDALAHLLRPLQAEPALAAVLRDLDVLDAPPPSAAVLWLSRDPAARSSIAYAPFGVDPQRAQGASPTATEDATRYRPFGDERVEVLASTASSAGMASITSLDDRGPYRPFDTDVAQTAFDGDVSSAHGESPYRPFGTETRSPPVVSANCVGDWSELRGPEAVSSACQMRRPGDALEASASVLLHPVTQRVGDVYLSVPGAGAWTLVAAVPMAVAQVELGSGLGRALELTAARPETDPFGPLSAMERVYVLTDAGSPPVARSRFASAASVVCGEARHCDVFTLEHHAGVVVGLVHVRPASLKKAVLLPGAWLFQMARGSTR